MTQDEFFQRLVALIDEFEAETNAIEVVVTFDDEHIFHWDGVTMQKEEKK
jgi:hypothetical protein